MCLRITTARTMPALLLRVLSVLHALAHLHGNNRVLALLRVAFTVQDVDLVLSEPVLDGITDREQLGMLCIHRANVIHDAVALQDVLLAEHLLRLFVLAVCTKDLACYRFGPLFGHTAGG
jgi:hypothetical protein